MRHWVFDYDNTLAWNTHDYGYPVLDLARFIIDELGHLAPHVSEIISLEQEIDRGRHKELGFRMERFPGSLVLTYDTICEAAGVTPSNAHRQHIYDIGLRAFDEERYHNIGLREGVEETVQYLLDRGDKLSLLSAGDPRVQQKKFDANNIERFFERTLIVPHKEERHVKQLVGDHPLSHVYLVGDSLRGEIPLALEMGASAVYTPAHNWCLEPKREENGFGNHPRFNAIEDIREIRDRYEELR